MDFEPTAITIFVGPHNVGKSKAVAEIAAQCLEGGVYPSDVIIDKLSFAGRSVPEADNLLDNLITPSPPEIGVDPGTVYVNQRNGGARVRRRALSTPLSTLKTWIGASVLLLATLV